MTSLLYCTRVLLSTDTGGDKAISDTTTTPAPRRDLPPGYVLAGEIDLANDQRAMVILSVASLVLLVLTGIGFAQAIDALRPLDQPFAGSFVIGSFQSLLLFFVTIIAATFIVIVIHEAVHGMFFWLFTRERPQFGFRGIYAFAAAPDWYLPRLQYAVVGGAPLLLISLLGLAISPLLPAAVLPLLLFVLALNASGAVGDILVLAWIARSRRGSLFRDRGDAIERYDYHERPVSG